MLNRVALVGRLTRDPELKTTNNGKEVANFTVAVNRRFQNDEADFFDVKGWGKTGVFVDTYFKKGQEILVRGSMQCRKWEDNDGNKRSAWELVADEVDFCGSKNSAPAEGAPTETNTADLLPNIPADTADDDLPF